MDLFKSLHGCVKVDTCIFRTLPIQTKLYFDHNVSIYNYCDVRRVWVTSPGMRLFHFSKKSTPGSSVVLNLTAEAFDKSLLQINKNSSRWHLSLDIRCHKEAFHGQVITLISITYSSSKEHIFVHLLNFLCQRCQCQSRLHWPS